VEVPPTQKPADRRTFATGDDESVDAVKVFRKPNLDDSNSKAPERGDVLLEVALQGEDADG
jgi:hypothetical protein